MGGALGILLAERLPGRVTAFVNAVGNLVPEDCFWSREAAAQPPDAFVRGGFPRFREAIRAMPARGRRPSTYEHSLERCDPAVFHRLSSDLVSLCEHGDLLGRWLRLPCRKVYLRDSDHAPAPALLDALRHAGVPVVLVPHSGHALMEHAPEFFYAAVARFLAGQTL
jgi:pimeloyl-ACP methyl ester carboxylesterase